MTKKTETTAPQETSSNSKNAKRRRVIEVMFTNFSVAYRHLWHKEFENIRYQEYAKKTWEKHLREFSDAIISKAADIWAKHNERPPTVAQFISVCKNERNRGFVQKRETVAKASPETAHYHLQKIKDILNNRR